MQSISELKDLKNGATLFGKFYPTDYVVAIYRNARLCQDAFDQLQRMGWADEDLIVVDGATFQVHQAEIRENRTFVDKFCAMLADKDAFASASNTMSSEDDYRFILIYAPTEELTAQVRQVVAPHAIYAQKYETLSFSEIETHGKADIQDSSLPI